ncbi:MAG: outer membrane lipoprotein-sorting protein [Gammaproteobacteria bacterium]|nr:outer membrane lipoprotein-sorting protein [Gammaproteobacteria bacterium]
MTASLLVASAVMSAPPAMDGDAIAREVYTATHGGLVNNAVSKRHGQESAVIVNRVPLAMRHAGRRPIVQTFDTFVNNQPANPELESIRLAILTSGKAKDAGVMLENYKDTARSSVITLWLPALRKFRRISEPAHDDVWFGSTITYGEISLRRPEHETHELLGEEVFNDCLPVMELSDAEKGRYTLNMPEPQCEHKGRPVYVLKSTTKFSKWWYDYHISEIDKESFALYRTVYYKDGEKVKSIFIDWQPLDRPDPRITYPRFIYAVMHTDGKDSMVFVPRSTIALDVDLPDEFWTEKTMENYGTE